MKYKHIEWEKETLKNNLEFNIAKAAFITFMMGKKRSNKEITVFLKNYPKILRPKLESLTARKFTQDELAFTKKEVSKLKKELAHKLKELNAARKIFESEIDPTIERGIGSKKTIIDLFDTDDVEEVDGMIVWNGDDVFEEEVELINDDE